MGIEVENHLHLHLHAILSFSVIETQGHASRAVPNRTRSQGTDVWSASSVIQLVPIIMVMHNSASYVFELVAACGCAILILNTTLIAASINHVSLSLGSLIT